LRDLYKIRFRINNMPSKSAWDYIVNKATDALQNTADYAKGVKQRYEQHRATEAELSQEAAAAPAAAKAAVSAPATPAAAAPTTQPNHTMSYLPGAGSNPMAEADAESK
jgi:hypothetical protein